MTAAPRPFVKLANSATYVACPWELHVDVEAREYWVGLFKRHLIGSLDLGVEAAVRRGSDRPHPQAVP